MKRFFIAIIAAIALTFVPTAAARDSVEHLAADRKSGKAFAIFTDTETWQHCSTAIKAYKDVLESEGLGTHVYVADWESPDKVKSIILRLAASRRQPLEGAVFIGDIPYARIGGAQHMTTAFKMNEQAFPRTESWVVSDRFYDDFDLDFEFIDSDSTGFYYRLTDKGAQTLSSDIYTARMLVPADMDDRYGRLNRYLDEVVRAHGQDNPLDDVVFYAGSAYNSDCLTIWRQKPLSWREYFPDAFLKSSTNKFLNWRYGREDVITDMGYEIRNPDHDLIQFTEHGAYDTQYMTSSEGATDLESDLQRIRSVLREYYSHYRGTEDEQPFLEEALNDYGTGIRFFADSLYAEDAVRDSLNDKLDNLKLDRIAEMSTGARVVLLNACYNGSFYEDGYVAGYHLFNGGNCIVVQGNTVNVLQDKYEDELMGVLDAGVRIGVWQKGLPYLESHLIGDPTFRFAVKDREFVSEFEALDPDIDYWMAQLDSPVALHRAAALKKIHQCGAYPGFSDSLLSVFSKDPSWQVRLEALHILSFYDDSNRSIAVLKAFDDPYERISRMAVRMALFIGEPVFRDALKDILEQDNDRQRVQFIAADALQVLDSLDASNVSCMKAIMTGSDESKISSIRFLRNYNLHFALPKLLPMLSDETLSADVRLCLAEALGWFNFSVDKSLIIDYIESMDLGSLDSALASELRKTIKRLRHE